MKIATWNLERPVKTGKKLLLITSVLQTLDADILILTESNEAVYLGNGYNYHHTEVLKESFYKEGERRTSIYTKYPVVEKFETFRDDTSLCVSLQTPFGILTVYGTVIGINGNRRHNFNNDLEQQLLDFERIAPQTNFCIAGDLNMSLGDNYYFTEDGRRKLTNAFEKLNLENLTANIPQHIDHIIVSKNFMKGKVSEPPVTWKNEKNKLSDHIGVCVTIKEPI